MSKNFFLIFVLGCLFDLNQVFAQKVDDDIIKIKNGPTIYGGLDSIRRDSIFFRVNGKIPVSYPISQIEEFKKDDNYSSKTAKKSNSINKNSNESIIPNSKGLCYTVSSGFSFFRALAPKFTLGYRINQHLIPIASVDYTYYQNAPGQFVGLQGGITGSFKSFDKNWKSPYYSIQAGYGINKTKNNSWEYGTILSKKGGFKMDIGMGMLYAIVDSKIQLSFGLNYGTQQAEFNYFSDQWDWNLGRFESIQVKETILYNRMYLTGGIHF